MRIFIIGCAGSGKTTLARKLSAKFHTPVYELDDLHFEKKFSIVRPKPERIALLHELVGHKEWIIEGSQAGWTHEVVACADVIIELKSNRPLMIVRAMRRYYRRKFQKNPPEENIKGLIDLCRYIWAYEHPLKKYKQEYNDLMLYAKGKRVVLRSKKQVDQFVKELTEEARTR